MKSLGNDVHYLSENWHARIKIYQEFYHGISYIANEVGHIRFIHNSVLIQGSVYTGFCLFSVGRFHCKWFVIGGPKKDY